MANPLAPNPDEEDLADLLARTSRAPPGVPISTPPPSPMPKSFGLGPSDPVGGLLPGTLTGPGVMTDLPMLDTGGSRIGLEAPESPPQPEPEEPAPGITEEAKQPAFKYSSETQRETDKLVKMLEENAEDARTVYREYDRTKNPIYKEILEALHERGKVQVPPLQPLPQPPGFRNDFEHARQGNLGFAVAAGALFFGARAKGSLTTVMSALAGTMQGIAQNNKDAAAQEMERWKAAMDYTIKANKQVREQYEDILKAQNTDLDTKFEMLKVVASAEGDKLGELAAQRKNISDLGTLIIKNKEVEIRGRASELQMRRLEEVIRRADEKAGKKTAQADTDDENDQIGFIAKRALRVGMQQAVSGMARSAGVIPAVNARLAKWEAEGKVIDGQKVTGAAVDAAGARYAAGLTEARTIGHRAGILGVTVEEFEPLTDQFLALVDQVPRTNNVPLNRLLRAGRTDYLGNTLEGRLHIMAEDVKATYQQIMARGGANSDLARHTADSLINEAGTREQMRANVDQLRQSLSAVRVAPGKALDEMMRHILGQQAAPAPTAPPTLSGAGPKTTAPKYKEGDTATGPNGEKWIFRNGEWGPQ